MMNLAVIIPYYNGARFIHRCIHSLEGYSKDKIFLVDNSTEPTPEDLPVTYIKSDRDKIGFGAAVNLGLEYMFQKDFTHVLILNQDAYFQKNHFSRLLEKLKTIDLNKFASPMIFTNDFSEIMPFLKYRYFPEKAPTSDVDISDFVAVSLIAPVTLMKKLNGFDTSYYMYYEDNDLFARSKIENPIRIFPEVHVGHYNPELDKIYSPEKEQWIRKSRQKYLWRHGSKVDWFIAAVKNLLSRFK